MSINRKNILFFIRLITSIGVIVFLVFFIDFKELLKTVSNANISFILIAYFLSFLNLFLQYIKWKTIVENQLNEKNSLKILKSLFYGIGAGMFTPVKAGEYIARAIPFPEKKITDISIATFVDKVFGMLLVFIIGSVLFSIYSYKYYVQSGIVSIELYISLISGVVIIMTVALVAIFNRNRIFSFLIRNKFISKLADKLKVLRGIDLRLSGKLLFLSFIFQLTFTFQFAILISAFETNFNLFDFFIIANLIVFFQILIPPLFLGELGVREGAAVFFMSTYGYEASAGFNAALCLFLINFILPSLYSFFITSIKEK
jgi:uncharacterized membrane protein YbhN (UPF0104 family)